jgi:stearoyl-CoA desaturase (delta-9 desaturase)
MATSSPVVAASAAKAATPAEAAAKLGATYPHEQMATRPLDLNPAHWYEAIKWHYDGGTLNWPMIIYIGLCHYWAVLGLTRLATVHTYTLLWAYALWPITGLGITAGVHRLWSHRSYTAGPALRCLLMLMNSIANQGSIFHWARDHRVHHKHSESTADPHNAQRGFFYAHVGWLLCKKHPDVVKEGKKLDFNDLKRDGFVMFQRKLDPWFTMFMCFVFPGLVAKFGWGERFWDAVWVAGFLRYIFVLHSTWLVNSAAHIFGDHPYNEQWPAENPIVSFFAVGEGWHNWHHQYPYDYAASEFGITSQFNPTKLFIDFFCVIGMASNPKRATSSWERTKMKRDKGVFEKSNFVLCMEGYAARGADAAEAYPAKKQD